MVVVLGLIMYVVVYVSLSYYIAMFLATSNNLWLATLILVDDIPVTPKCRVGIKICWTLWEI